MRLPELENELKTIYGEDASRVFRTILPGILMDFTRMINAAGLAVEFQPEEEQKAE